MNNNGDWKEIEDFIQKEKNKTIEKYGFDIYENFQNKNSKEALKKRKHIKRTVIIINIILIIILILSCCLNLVQFKYKRTRISNLQSIYQLNFEEKSVNTDITGNGFLIYKIEEIPELEIHAIAKKNDNTFIEDVEAKIYKYFFDRWNNPDKNKFIVEESYDDYTYKLYRKKNWILRFKTYIEVNNYEEMLNATETIIKFRNYMNYPQIIVESYIKYDNKLILPHNVSNQKDDEIRESARTQFDLIKKGER